MELNNEQIEQVKSACRQTDFGSVTIKLNKTAKFVDIVVEKQIRLHNEATITNTESKERKY